MKNSTNIFEVQQEIRVIGMIRILLIENTANKFSHKRKYFIEVFINYQNKLLVN